jgi:hypothetical protein
MSVILTAMKEYVPTLAKVWKHDRTKTIGASEIGLCERRVWASKKDIPHDVDHEETWGARMRGTMMEDYFWYPALKLKYGKDLVLAGPDQKTFQDGKLSATPDGILINQRLDILKKDHGIKSIKSKHLVVEAKSIDPRVNLSSAKHENEFQTQVQMGLIRKLTPYKPFFALISYTDASFWNEISEYPIEFNPAVFKGAEGRAAKILATDRMEDMKPEGYIAGGKECEFCPWIKRCGVERRSFPSTTKEADPQFAAEIDDMVRALQVLKDAGKANDVKVKEQEEAIKARLKERAVRKIPGIVTWSPVKGRESYDMKGIKAAAVAAGVDIEQFATVGEPTDRLQTFKTKDEPGLQA